MFFSIYENAGALFKRVNSFIIREIKGDFFFGLNILMGCIPFIMKLLAEIMALFKKKMHFIDVLFLFVEFIRNFRPNKEFEIPILKN